MQSPLIVVDDTEVFLECLKSFLLLKGYSRVMAFTSPKEALRYIEKNGRPACIVADFDMPEMNGVELLDAVSGLFPGVESVIVTGAPSRLSGQKKYPVIPKDGADFFDVVTEYVGSRVSPG